MKQRGPEPKGARSHVFSTFSPIPDPYKFSCGLDVSARWPRQLRNAVSQLSVVSNLDQDSTFKVLGPGPYGLFCDMMSLRLLGSLSWERPCEPSSNHGSRKSRARCPTTVSSKSPTSMSYIVQERPRRVSRIIVKKERPTSVLWKNVKQKCFWKL